MATEETTQQLDDRWSGFVDPDRSLFSRKKVAVDPGPDLSEYIEKVIHQRSPRKQHERMYKLVANFVHLITSVAYAMTSEWKLYLQTSKTQDIRTTDLRALSVDRYECMVPLMRPLKPDAFQISTKGMDEMPPHRCLVGLNSNLSHEERMLVSKEWNPHIDKQGHLNMRGILRWFNYGLSKATSVVLAESKNISNLRCVTSLDGTAVIHVAVIVETREKDNNEKSTGNGEPEVVHFSVNMFPVFVVDKLPANLQINIPLPVGRPYGNIKKQLKEAILEDLEAGKHIIFLEPKKEMTNSPIKNSLTAEGPSWAYNMSFTERYVYNILDKHCGELDYRQILILFNIIREQQPVELTVLNTEIIVNSLFNVFRKHFVKMGAFHDCFFELLKYLKNGFKSGFIPSFYLPRQNLLMRYNVSEKDATVAASKLGEVLKAVQTDPKHIYVFTGYKHKKKGRNGSDDSDSESDEGDKENNDADDEADDGDDDDDNTDGLNSVEKATDNTNTKTIM